MITAGTTANTNTTKGTSLASRSYPAGGRCRGWWASGLATEKMLRPWSQQARQLTPRRGTVAHLGNRGCCVHRNKETKP